MSQVQVLIGSVPLNQEQADVAKTMADIMFKRSHSFMTSYYGWKQSKVDEQLNYLLRSAEILRLFDGTWTHPAIRFAGDKAKLNGTIEEVFGPPHSPIEA